MNEHGQPDNNQPEQTEQQPNNAASEQPEQPDNSASEPSPDNQQNKRQFWQGIVWGCIPLVLFLVTTALFRFSQNYNDIIGLIFSVLAYITVLIMAVVYLFQPRRRFLGYGLLTMVLVAPIIGAIGCTVAAQIPL